MIPRFRQFVPVWLIEMLCVVLGVAWCAWSAGAGDDLFASTSIRHLRIEITKKDMAILRKPVPRERNRSDRPSVSATVREEALVWTNVAVHLKGSVGSFRSVDDRPGLTLNFDKLASRQRFHGLQKISLNNSVQDPSLVSEKVCRELYAAAGVPVPRVDYATVELNGRHLGLYVLAEGWNKQFLRRHFKNAQGNFYDPGSQRDIDYSLKADFGESPGDNVALKAAQAAINEPNHAKRVERLREAVDLDRLLSMHAVDVLLWNWDGYGMGRNNFRLFHDLDANRLVFFPHGLDQMFWKPDGPIVTGRAGLVVKSLLETREGRRLYLERFGQLRSSVFDVHTITNRVAELSARIQPALRDRSVRARQQESSLRLRKLIVARARNVDAQLASVGKDFQPLEVNAVMPLTQWTARTNAGNIQFGPVPNAPSALRLLATGSPNLGFGTTTVWLEEGRYRIEGRVKTAAVQPDAPEGGAGFRVWSTRKEARGPSWDWFPYTHLRDARLGRLIPAFSNARQQRLTWNNPWTLVTHEFELRQPLADVQIQCVLEAPWGAAWFDMSSIQIRRVALEVTKNSARGD